MRTKDIQTELTFPLFIYWAALEPSPLLLRSFAGLLYQPWMTYDDSRETGGMHNWR
jgi:hypothetical protein